MQTVTGNTALVHENELLFAVSIIVLAVEPLRAIDNFRQDQCRLDRIEHPGFMKIEKRPPTQTAAVNIGEKLSRAPLGDDARHQITDAPADRHRLYERKFLGESRDDVRMRDLLFAPQPYFAFFLRSFENLLPLALPTLLGFGGPGGNHQAQRHQQG